MVYNREFSIHISIYLSLLHNAIARKKQHALIFNPPTRRAVKGALVIGGGCGRAFQSRDVTWEGSTVSWGETVAAAVAGRRAIAACTLQLNLATGSECLVSSVVGFCCFFFKH